MAMGLRPVAIAMFVLGMSLGGGAAQAVVIEENFDDAVFDDAVLSDSLTIGVLGAPGACSNFSGPGGSALCGTDLRVASDPLPPPATLTFSDIDFTRGGTLRFSLGATTTAAFESDQDFIRVVAGGVEIADFVSAPLNGVANQTLASSTGLVTTSLSSSMLEIEVAIDDIGSTETNGSVQFQFLTTSVNEFVAIDSVFIEHSVRTGVIPLPPTAVLLIGAVAGIAVMRRRQRQA
ncbi:MAG: VPLPA-CTERM sorting domain-containing protein [Pseudomonadota bacterium]